MIRRHRGAIRVDVPLLKEIGSAGVRPLRRRVVKSWLVARVTAHGVQVYLKGNSPLVRAAGVRSRSHREFGRGSVLYLRAHVERDSRNIPFVEVADFYSRLHLDRTFARSAAKVASPEELDRLRGIGHSALCHMLRTWLHLGLLNSNSYVTLDAESRGFRHRKSPIRDLVAYYMRLGFKPPDPSRLRIRMNWGSVPLVAPLHHLLTRCDDSARQQFD